MSTEVRAQAASGGLAPAGWPFGLLLRAFPADFRAEYGPELARDYARLRLEGGAPLFWRTLLSDVARGALRERVASWREGRAARLAADPFPPPYRAAVLAALGIWVLYGLTLAPSIAFWDSGEYVTVAHILGIPHPPGNPLFVLLAHAWELLLSATRLPVAVRINLLSATASAAAHGFWFLVADRLLAPAVPGRWLRRAGALAAVALSATAFTVWSQSDVNEKVYTLSLLSTAALVWLGLRWRDVGALRPVRPAWAGRVGTGAGARGLRGRTHGHRRLAPLLLGVLLLALAATNHLMGMLAAPALLLFVLLVEPRALRGRRFWLPALALAVLGLSVQLFLP
ncbi:MAG TPA: DUF2723 domain-containing protein, partial [Longimicrobiales bacterium]